jgi:hypothetical protein
MIFGQKMKLIIITIIKQELVYGGFDRITKEVWEKAEVIKTMY